MEELKIVYYKEKNIFFCFLKRDRGIAFRPLPLLLSTKENLLDIKRVVEVIENAIKEEGSRGLSYEELLYLPVGGLIRDELGSFLIRHRICMWTEAVFCTVQRPPRVLTMPESELLPSKVYIHPFSKTSSLKAFLSIMSMHVCEYGWGLERMVVKKIG